MRLAAPGINVTTLALSADDYDSDESVSGTDHGGFQPAVLYSTIGVAAIALLGWW